MSEERGRENVKWLFFFRFSIKCSVLPLFFFFLLRSLNIFFNNTHVIVLLPLLLLCSIIITVIRIVIDFPYDSFVVLKEKPEHIIIRSFEPLLDVL